jgi:hypothetical protein
MNYQMMDKFLSLVGGTVLLIFLLDIFRLIVPFTDKSIISIYAVGGAIMAPLLYYLLKGDLEGLF